MADQKTTATATATAPVDAPVEIANRTRSSEPSIYTLAKNLFVDIYKAAQGDSALASAIKAAAPAWQGLADEVFTKMPTGRSAMTLSEVEASIKALWNPKNENGIMSSDPKRVEAVQEELRLLLARQHALKVKSGERGKS